MTTTLIKYIKDGKYDTALFLIERLNETDKNNLNIKTFNEKNWIYIKYNRIVPKNINLVKNRTYELSDVKTRMWNDYHVKTYHLTQTFETLSMKTESESICLL